MYKTGHGSLFKHQRLYRDTERPLKNRELAQNVLASTGEIYAIDAL
jgi:hypothetical protein